QEVEVLRVLEPLGRDVHELRIAVHHVVDRLALLGRRERRIELRRRNVARLELLLLVLHEGDQRRHDDGRLAREERGKLVAERFSAARGQDAEHVAAGEDGLEDLALSGPEGAHAEALARGALDARPRDRPGAGRRHDRRSKRRARRRAGPARAGCRIARRARARHDAGRPVRRSVVDMPDRFATPRNRDVPVAAPGEFRPLRLGDLAVWPPVVLAPMAGVTNYAFRSLCREFGAGLYVSEMITARGFLEGNRRTRLLASSRPDESPRSVQIYGTDPAEVEEMVRALVGEGVDHVDVNFGCPAPKITRYGGGSAIPLKPRLMARLVA